MPLPPWAKPEIVRIRVPKPVAKTSAARSKPKLDLTPIAFDALKAFDRFYQKHVALPVATDPAEKLSSTEVRVLTLLARRHQPLARHLAEELEMDEGHLSRIFKKFEKLKILKRSVDEKDARVWTIVLSDEGRKWAKRCDRQALARADALLRRLRPSAQQELMQAMRRFEHVVRKGERNPLDRGISDIRLRGEAAGELGLLLHRFIEVMKRDGQATQRLEIVAAAAIAEMLVRPDPQFQRCWIAEHQGRILGCCLLVKQGEATAGLPIFYVEHEARNLGIGHMLLQVAMTKAEIAGFEQVVVEGVEGAAAGLFGRMGFVEAAGVWAWELGISRGIGP